jgi:hypothetical protein
MLIVCSVLSGGFSSNSSTFMASSTWGVWGGCMCVFGRRGGGCMGPARRSREARGGAAAARLGQRRRGPRAAGRKRSTGTRLTAFDRPRFKAPAPHLEDAQVQRVVLVGGRRRDGDVGVGAAVVVDERLHVHAVAMGAGGGMGWGEVGWRGSVQVQGPKGPRPRLPSLPSSPAPHYQPPSPRPCTRGLPPSQSSQLVARQDDHVLGGGPSSPAAPPPPSPRPCPGPTAARPPPSRLTAGRPTG